MKEHFQLLAAYNVWANHKLLFAIQQMEDHEVYRQVASSFDSLYKTVMHIWDAESAWMQRMRLHERVVFPSQNFDPSVKDACNGLLHQSMEWESFITQHITPEVLMSDLHYTNTKGEAFVQPVFQVLMHVFNHSTYHRGQLVTQMRALGKTQIPQTDFIVFTRRKRFDTAG